MFVVCDWDFQACVSTGEKILHEQHQIFAYFQNFLQEESRSLSCSLDPDI